MRKAFTMHACSLFTSSQFPQKIFDIVTTMLDGAFEGGMQTGK